MTDQQQLVNAFRNNPNDPRNLVRLIQSLNQAGKYTPATNLLKKIITGPGATEQKKSIRDTAIRCAKKTYLNRANRELDNNRPQQALQVFAELVRMMDTLGINDPRSESELAKINFDANDTTLLNTRTCQRLLTTLLGRSEIVKAVNLLGKRDCIVTYPLAVRVMREFANSNQSKNDSNIRKNIKLLANLLTTLGIQENKKNIINSSIYSNAHYPMSPWREKILSRYNLEEMQKWIKLSGLDILQQAQEQGRGVILVSSHMSTGRFLNLLLDRQGHRINALEVRDRMGKFGIQASSNLRVLELGESVEFPLRELFLVQKALKKGEIANLSGDGFRGKSGVMVDFLGRKRDFKTSYAELAIKTGAPALPVFGTAKTSGKIHLQIKPALDMGDKDMPHEERVAAMVKQYAALLEQVWRKKPGDIAWEQIRYYSSLPTTAATEDTSGANSDGI